MKKVLVLTSIILIITNQVISQSNYGLPKIKIIDYQSDNREWFVKYGQCQINFDYTNDTITDLAIVKEPEKQIEKIKNCLNIAKKNKFNVLIFPELTVSLPEPERVEIFNILESFSKDNDMIIIAGTYYDNNRNSRIVTFLPTGIYLGYKIRPSRFEASPVDGEGMQYADTLVVFKTKFGNFLPITCVDLISDDANYIARNLSNKGIIDLLININYNPKSQEFIREASAMVVRHPLFVSITNVTLYKTGCTLDGNEYGNSSILGSLNEDSRKRLFKNINDCFKTCDKKNLQPAYKSLIANINP